MESDFLTLSTRNNLCKLVDRQLVPSNSDVSYTGESDNVKNWALKTG